MQNIIGLYVGQDLPHKLAYFNFNRLKKIFYKSPSLRRKCIRWTLKDDQRLLNFVIDSQTSKVDMVSKISDKDVNWVAYKVRIVSRKIQHGHMRTLAKKKEKYER